MIIGIISAVMATTVVIGLISYLIAKKLTDENNDYWN